MRAKEPSGERLHGFRRSVLRLLAGIAVCSLLLIGTAKEAVAEGEFEIIVSIDTVVIAPEDSVTVLRATPVPNDLAGQTCSVIARSTNQSSVHPGNDLVIESLTRTVLTDVEAEPGGTVTATDDMALGDQILINLVMGPDAVFSAGIDVLFDCPPESTTTTSPTVSTTTTVASSTTSTQGSSTTTTEVGSTETTIEVSTTTTANVATTTTLGPTTTTTIQDEVLAYTGPPDERVVLLAIAMITSGVLVLLGERTAVLSRVGSLVAYRRRCKRCHREAYFMTPHGRLCMTHTRIALDDDTELWMPTKLKPPS